jgi:hypothetical protein
MKTKSPRGSIPKPGPLQATTLIMAAIEGADLPYNFDHESFLKLLPAMIVKQSIDRLTDVVRENTAAVRGSRRAPKQGFIPGMTDDVLPVDDVDDGDFLGD